MPQKYVVPQTKLDIHKYFITMTSRITSNSFPFSIYYGISQITVRKKWRGHCLDIIFLLCPKQYLTLAQGQCYHF